MVSIVSVVIHPNPIFREGLASILAKSPFVPAFTASSTNDVPKTIGGGGERVLVLLGVREDSNLAEAVSAKANFPDAHLVAIGDSTKYENVTTVLELGATSFVDENVTTSTLVKELELVTLGEPVISVLILKQLLGRCSAHSCEEAVAMPVVDQPRSSEAQDEAEPTLRLSGREAAILNALVQGASNKVIANGLKITEATVKVHVKAILRKIRVRNRTQAAIWALNHQASSKTFGARNDGAPLTAAASAYAKSDSSMIDTGPAEKCT